MNGVTIDPTALSFTINTLKEHSGTAPFKIRYSEQAYSSATPTLKVLEQDSIEITYVDDCAVPASSTISPFTTVLDM